MLESVFLHNTKISSSAHNEKKEAERKRGYFNAKGRKIHLLQMLQSQLNYSEVFMDMNFISVSTSPLEERSGCEKKFMSMKTSE